MEYVNYRLRILRRNIGDLICDLAEKRLRCVVDRLQWLLKNDNNFVRTCVSCTADTGEILDEHRNEVDAGAVVA